MRSGVMGGEYCKRQDKSFENFEREKKKISETQAKGVAILISADTKRTKDTERMYSQKFAKEETKYRKDKHSHEVTLSLISEKQEKKSKRWNTRFQKWRKKLMKREQNLNRI